MRIYISGLYSGTNPQPGIGIARSLRQAYPSAHLVGVEYSNRCSGIHWRDFDEIWLQRPWEELSLGLHADEIRNIVDSGALWISSIDLEIMWLARVFPDGHPNLLTAPPAALENVAKPGIAAHRGLPVAIPPFVTTEIPDWDLHSFCREHDWKVWLKGPYYEAVRTESWARLEEMRAVLSQAWATEKLFLQSHVSGYEESVTLAAYRGELLDCVRMRKRDLTELSKTWAGDISEVGEEMLEPLRRIIRAINWTGGAELEMVRDSSDRLWLLEWNPRFPAWIHGATITGRNIPAALVEGATGIPALESVALAEEFTRVVIEVPVRREFPLPPLPEPLGGTVGHSLKHPSGLLEFASRLKKEEGGLTGRGGRQPVAARIPLTYVEDLRGVDLEEIPTPSGIFMPSTAEGEFRRAAATASELSTPSVEVVSAYSIKTNPDERLVRLALRHGLYAEAISLPEAAKAMAAGFPPEKIIFNGPAKWWRRDDFGDAARFHAVFCDSLEELGNVVRWVASGEIESDFVGVRLRTPNIPSRFGIPVDSPRDLEKLVRAVGTVPAGTRFGIHFHMASSHVGIGRWEHLFESMLRWGRSVEALTGRPVEMLDVGGGWFPGDVHRGPASRLAEAVSMIPSFLPNVGRVITEPGKALAQPSWSVAMRILEIRDRGSRGREIVVDGSIAELPQHFFYPHRVLFNDSSMGGWRALGRGDSTILGRLCMEHDVVAMNVGLPRNAAVGDVLVFCDAGAYDRSMSYVFGCG